MKGLKKGSKVAKESDASIFSTSESQCSSKEKPIYDNYFVIIGGW